MVEIIKAVKQSKPHIDAIHGHTIIELKNIKNGNRERIESDNIVTNGAESLLRQLGPSLTVGFAGYSIEGAQVPLWAYLFGGLLLFDKTVPTDPTPSRFMPVGTKMTGNGSYKIHNSTETTEMGSYNFNESEENQYSVKQVYDFSTQQANGEINSVCLTSFLGGYAGYGNGTSEISRYDKLARTNMFGNPRGLSGVSGTDFSYISVGYYNNRGFRIVLDTVSGNRIAKVSEYGCSIEEFSAFNERFDSVMGASAEVHEVPLGTTRSGNMKFKILDGKAYGCFSDFGDKTVYIIDLSTFVCTPHVLTGTPSYSGYGSGEGFIYYKPYDLNSGYMLFGSQLYHINLLTDEATLAHSFGGSGSPRDRIGKFTDGLLFVKSDVKSFPNTGSDTMLIYDPYNDTIYPTNLNVGLQSYANVSMDYDATADLLVERTFGSYYTSAWDDYRHFPHPWRLATINNLSDTIIKTALTTMKVTYTLTME